MLTVNDFYYDNKEITINETQKLQIEEYKSTKLPEKREELLKFINHNLQEDNNINSNINHIEELIDIIVKWYEFKYSYNKILMLEEKYARGNSLFSFYTSKYRVENLNNNMGYTELMFRIPEYLHPILECWYKKDSKASSYYVKAPIFTKYTQNEFHQDISFDIYDGKFELGQFVFNKIINTDYRSLEELLNHEDEYPDIDFSYLKSIELNHKLDLELRSKILNLIAFKLLFSSEDIMVGYIRGKKFIEEFNKYLYNINLSSEEIDDFIDKLNINNFYRIFNYIVNIFDGNKTKNISIDEFGLSFNTICYLKQNNIYKLSDIEKTNFDIYGDGVVYRHVPEQDIIIYEEMKKNALHCCCDEKPHSTPNNYTIANIKEEPNEEKIEESPKKQKKLFKRFRK